MLTIWNQERTSDTVTAMPRGVFLTGIQLALPPAHISFTSTTSGVGSVSYVLKCPFGSPSPSWLAESLRSSVCETLSIRRNPAIWSQRTVSLDMIIRTSLARPGRYRFQWFLRYLLTPIRQLHAWIPLLAFRAASLYPMTLSTKCTKIKSR
jgi:hypothetical protein